MSIFFIYLNFYLFGFLFTNNPHTDSHKKSTSDVAISDGAEDDDQDVLSYWVFK